MYFQKVVGRGRGYSQNCVLFCIDFQRHTLLYWFSPNFSSRLRRSNIIIWIQENFFLRKICPPWYALTPPARGGVFIFRYSAQAPEKCKTPTRPSHRSALHGEFFKSLQPSATTITTWNFKFSGAAAAQCFLQTKKIYVQYTAMRGPRRRFVLSRYSGRASEKCKTPTRPSHRSALYGEFRSRYRILLFW